MFHVYILRCSDGSLYVGHCESLTERLATHQQGKGAKWTASRRPVVLVHSESFDTRAEAIARERQLKGWSRAKKLALIEGDTLRPRTLAKRRIV